MATVLRVLEKPPSATPEQAGPARQFTRGRMLAVLVALYIASGVFLVPPDRQAVVTRFGRVVDGRVMPGIHYTLPYPFARVHKLKVRETKRAVIGGEAADATLGRTEPLQAQFLTGDQNIIQMRVVAQYSVSSPADYLFMAADVDTLVRDAVETYMAVESARRGVDVLLTTDKVQVQEAVRARAQELLDRYRAGVQLSSVNIESMAPPAEVAEAFRDVAGARADAARIINESQGYANDVVPRARGAARQLAESATGYRTRKINEAQGDADRFNKLAGEYKNARQVTSDRLYVEAMEQILPRIKKLIVDSDLDLSIVTKKPE